MALRRGLYAVLDPARVAFGNIDHATADFGRIAEPQEAFADQIDAVVLHSIVVARPHYMREGHPGGAYVQFFEDEVTERHPRHPVVA